MNKEVLRHTQRLDALFQRVRELPGRMKEGEEYERYQADLARYLCVLVSGYLETAMRDIYGQYAATRCSPQVLRYVNHHLGRFSNPKMGKIRALAGLFDPEWQESLGGTVDEEIEAAIDSVVNLRNQIAHGQDTGVSYAVVADYYKKAQRLVQAIESQCGQ
jgi:hypothetical protein